MGVTSLWQILQPGARPAKLSTLHRKRLAVDASIWIYQFLKAVRDKEGNALRNSHVVGFFRRICKLLYFGIKPVFVFDGGAPSLKRATVMARKRRREGRREDAVRTAGRLLGVQMQRRAEEEDARRKAERARREEEREEEVPEEGLVYVDELQMSKQEREQNRKFRKKDAYHLPDLDAPIHGQEGDLRTMTLEELQSYASQFESGEDINVYDFSKIDYDSPFFTSLPASDRYNILNAARLRSRLRMGHSKEQLDTMFPDRMEFSRFQIERVKERNELTTRLMNINDGDINFADGVGGSNRVAGEKAREYVLVKNDGIEGGYALGVIVGDEGSKAENAIDLDRPVAVVKDESSDDENEGFEDVPIEGLNRLPKRRKLNVEADEGTLDSARQATHWARKPGRGRRWDVNGMRGTGAKPRARKPKAKPIVPRPDDPESLFVADEAAEGVESEAEELCEDVDENGSADEDEDLQAAIAMSLEQDPEAASDLTSEQQEQTNTLLDGFQQRAAEEARPVPKGDWKAIARTLNNRAKKTAGESREVTSFGVPHAKEHGDGKESDEEEDGVMDLQAALAESRRGKRKVSPPPRRQPGSAAAAKANGTPAKKAAGGFSGPLPFESLDLGSSLLGRKAKASQREPQPQPQPQQPADEVQEAGGFETMYDTEARLQQARDTGPMPPWFSGNLDDDMRRQEQVEREDRERAKEYNKHFRFTGTGEPALRRQKTGEVIDLDADESPPAKRTRNGEVIDLDADDEPAMTAAAADKRSGGEVVEIDGDDDGGGQVAPELMGKPVDDEIRMGDMADAVKAQPPTPERHDVRKPESASKQRGSAKKAKGPFVDEESEESEVEESFHQQQALDAAARSDEERTARKEAQDEDEEIEWSESEDERPAQATKGKVITSDAQPAGGVRVSPVQSPAPAVAFEKVQDHDAEAPPAARAPSRSASPDFEDVDMEKQQAARERSPEFDPAVVDEPLPELDPAIIDDPDDDPEPAGPAPAGGLAPQQSIPEGDDEFDDFDDPEEEEMLKALAAEAEEHARFASELNQNKSTAESLAEYEKELKQLRNQQKKDRRDADEVTHIMIQECQQLLRLFGLPYITAPMEAEAQCAELVRLGLVDGIVTDDSDCFLFGGTRVYKNFFNQAKFVECYLASDLEKEFDLTRGKMISVAQLLGSDYTEGLTGVGPVTALEILSEFGDLTVFRDWFNGVQLGQITKESDAGNPFRKKFRKQAAKIILPPSFPDPRVEAAYLQPEVDSDPEQFQWGVPDLAALRSFLMATIGWSQERTDEVLVPVIRDMNRRADEGTQANITAFFEGGVGVGAAGGEAFAPRKRVEGSKRMGKALGRLAERAKIQRTISQGGGVEGDSDAQAVDMTAVEAPDQVVEKQQNGQKKGRGKKRAAATADDGIGEDEGSDFEEQQPKKKGRKGAAVGGRGGKGRKKRVAVSENE